MPRTRNDFWTPADDWPDDDDPDYDASPELDACSDCGRYVTGPLCQGPGPYPRPCSMRLRMPPPADVVLPDLMLP
jgi:hypothetical protein